MIKDLFRPRERKPRFEDVVDRELATLYRVAKRLTLNETDAEDLVGQALLLGARGWDAFDGRHPRSWLIRVMRNEFLATRRKASFGRETAFEEGMEPSDDGFWHEVSWRAVGDQVLAELDKLPEEYRIAVTLVDVEEMDCNEAAEALGVPPATVRTRVFRGRKLLQARLARAVNE